MIEVVESGDLIITVKEYDKSVQLASGQAPIVLEEEDFLVSRAVIIANSKVLAAKIKYHPTVGDIISIQNDRALRVKDMQIWLNVLHGLVFTKEAFTADMKELWYIAVQAPLTKWSTSANIVIGRGGQIRVRYWCNIPMVCRMV